MFLNLHLHLHLHLHLVFWIFWLFIGFFGGVLIFYWFFLDFFIFWSFDFFWVFVSGLPLQWEPWFFLLWALMELATLNLILLGFDWGISQNPPPHQWKLGGEFLIVWSLNWIVKCKRLGLFYLSFQRNLDYIYYTC